MTRHPGRLPAALAAEQLRGAGKPGFMQALRANIDYPITERLPEIACPTLIVWGAEDKVIPVTDASVFEELIPNSRKVIFEDTGHMAMLERSFNRLLSDFIAESAARRVHGRVRPARDVLQLVTAPSAADPTSFAYLRIATSMCSSARGGWA